MYPIVPTYLYIFFQTQKISTILLFSALTELNPQITTTLNGTDPP